MEKADLPRAASASPPAPYERLGRERRNLVAPGPAGTFRRTAPGSHRPRMSSGCGRRRSPASAEPSETCLSRGANRAEEHQRLDHREDDGHRLAPHRLHPERVSPRDAANMEHGRRGRCLLFPSADRGQQRYKLPLRHREQRRAVLYVPTAERCDCETVVSLLAPWRDGYSAEWVQVPASAGTRNESTCRVPGWNGLAAQR